VLTKPKDGTWDEAGVKLYVEMLGTAANQNWEQEMNELFNSMILKLEP
jgi:hypothetical protein